MIRWNNDYNQGAHPAILEALEKTNSRSYGGYGLDEWCERGAAEIRKYLGDADVDIHLLVGGTQANFTVIAAALRPYQSVICAESGHIHVHETGAVENTGHKIQVLKAENGKINAGQIAEEAEAYRASGIQEHITEPKMVYLSFPTEYGTIYSRKELEEIRDVCTEYGMYLYVDGARLGYGLGAEDCDVTLEDLAALCDGFYIGGTKCGMLMGEAVVLKNHGLRDHFRSYIKQNGGMLAKGWLLGLQYAVLFENDLYFQITEKADKQAAEIRAAFREKGIPFYVESSTNQQFVILKEEERETLAENHIFEYEDKIDETHQCVRFCTSWATRDEDVETLIRDIRAL